MEKEVKIKVAILGSTGYVGNELVRILSQHEKVELVFLGSKTYSQKAYFEVYPNAYKLTTLPCGDDELENLSKKVDLIFTATPQGFCASLMNENILKNTKIIDLSADFRLKNASVYEQWYKLEHKAKDFLNEAVYGLCEIHRDKIKKARLIANPGCYTTCSILSLYPLVKEGLIDTKSIIIDAKSGVSGAGRAERVDNLFCEVNESIKAYGLTNHRHTPEIEEQLNYAASKDIVLQFTPHLVPMQRGILTTSYVNLSKTGDIKQIKELYEHYYKDEYFIRLLPEGIYPQTRFVKGSNFVDINFVFDERTNRLIVLASIDNLIKGAAGQAVQNMNLLFGYDENLGLKAMGIL